MSSNHSQTTKQIPVSKDPRFHIAPGVQKGKLWISHECGEGGDFPAKQVRKAVKENRLQAYFSENF